jgi:prevent-host-death family protein
MLEVYIPPCCTVKRFAIVVGMDDKPIAEARANLTELVASVRLLRRAIQLTRRGKPQVALVPVELARAAEAVGGMDAAAEILERAARRR